MWPEPIYMRVSYVFESRFSAGIKKINKLLKLIKNYPY